MALAEILLKLAKKNDWKLRALHVNHLLRGKSSDADENFVRSWAKRKGIPLIVRKADVAAHQRLHKKGIEDAARKLRYDFLEQCALETGANKIVLAHTADDQAETLLWRLLRGSVSGLAGIPARRPAERNPQLSVVRPLLSVRKQEILAFLKKEKIPFRKDLSNQKNDFTRNKIRNRLIPFLQKNFNPSAVAVLNAIAQNLRNQRDAIESLTQEVLRRGILRGNGAEKHLQIAQLAPLPKAIQAEIFKHVFQAMGGDLARLHHKHINAFVSLTQKLPSSKQMHIGPVRIRREQKLIVFSAAHKAEPSLTGIALKIPGSTSFRGGTFQAKLCKWNRARFKAPSKPGSPALDNGAHVEHFDWDKLARPLRLRTRKPGDRYQPIGLQGTKKVKDILIERKIPLSARNRYPVLGDAKGRIVWLTGYRIADFCKVRPATRRVLRVHLTFDWKDPR